MRGAFLIILGLIFAFAYADANHSMFDAGKHCVAYKVKKKSLSLFNGTVIGKNCDISVQLLPVVGGGYQVEVSVPIEGFDSGDKDRDEDVKTILKASEQPDILFRSKVMSEQEWKQALLKPNLVLQGDLIIAGKSYAISAPSQITKIPGGVEIDGVAVVPFKQFDLQPPKVGGGIIAKADSDLELHFHLISTKILGADKVLAPPEKEKDILKEVMEKIDDHPAAPDDSKADDTSNAPEVTKTKDAGVKKDDVPASPLPSPAPAPKENAKTGGDVSQKGTP